MACGREEGTGEEIRASAASGQKFLRAEDAIPEQYVVVLEDSVMGKGAVDVRAMAREHAARYGGEVFHVYEHALRGYAIRVNEPRAQQLAREPGVKYVQQDAAVRIVENQPNATWGLDRVDQQSLPLNGLYSYNTTGRDVNVYVIDTGIRRTHVDFGGRAYPGTDTVGDGWNGDDCNGHGTHVAGTVGGSTYGVAKNAKLYSVRVLNCQGFGAWSGVIAGVDWVTANHVKPAVANMSLGGNAYQAADDAVTNSINAGVVYAIAAGNSNAPACSYSPARTPNAITVGATTNLDARSWFSNYGTCVDLFAPGGNITSAWWTSDTAVNTISGTSMAAPHVAGAAALYLEARPCATPAEVRDALVEHATSGVVTNPGAGSPNLLLYTSFISAPWPRQLLANPGFEDGNTMWITTPGVIDPTSDPYAPRSGSWKGWMNGYGVTWTDTLYQQITVPADVCSAQLSFWLWIDTAEVTPIPIDTLTVSVQDFQGAVLSTLAQFSNRDMTPGYVSQTYDLSDFRGKTIRIHFSGSENDGAPTAFLIDDAAVTVR